MILNRARRPPGHCCLRLSFRIKIRHSVVKSERLAVVGSGEYPQPRTASAGSLLSVAVCPGKNNTFGPELRESQCIFLPRDGPYRPSLPTEKRVAMRHRCRISNVVIPHAAEETDLSPAAAANDMGSAIRHWIWNGRYFLRLRNSIDRDYSRGAAMPRNGFGGFDVLAVGK